MSLGVCLGTIDNEWLNYSLMGMNFWILYNIKFNGISHGYYAVLLTLVVFQYLYFNG